MFLIQIGSQLIRASDLRMKLCESVKDIDEDDREMRVRSHEHEVDEHRRKENQR